MRNKYYFVALFIILAAGAIFYFNSARTRKVSQNQTTQPPQTEESTKTQQDVPPVPAKLSYTAFLATTPVSFNSLKLNLPKFDQIIGMWLHLDKTGIAETNKSTAAAQLKYIRANGQLKVQALVSNFFENNWQGQQTADMLADSSQRTAVEDQLVAYAKKTSLDGINVDFEQMPSSAQAGLAAFLKELQAKLAAESMVLSVDLPTSDSNLDLKGIGKIADQDIVMMYDQHENKNLPGSQTDLDWYQKYMDSAKAVFPADQLIIGLGNYNYAEATPQSILAQLKVVQKNKPEGIAIFRLGSVDQAIFDAVGRYRVNPN